MRRGGNYFPSIETPSDCQDEKMAGRKTMILPTFYQSLSQQLFSLSLTKDERFGVWIS